MVLPDRLAALIARVERGETITPEDWRRLATLQYLDLAKLGEDFAREAIAADAQLARTLEGFPDGQ